MFYNKFPNYTLTFITFIYYKKINILTIFKLEANESYA